MKALKKYFKKPTKEAVLTYSAGIGIATVFFVVIYLLYGKTLTGFVSDTEGFKQWLDAYRGLGWAVFVFIRAFQTVIKIVPAEPLEIVAGYAWGTWGGLILCSIGTFIGSVIIFLLSEYLGEKFVKAFINEDELQTLKIVADKRKQRRFLLIFYLIPSTPKDIMTYVAGSLKINPAEFFLITSFARIPSIITSTACGAQLGNNDIKSAAVIFILTLAASAACGLIYNKYRVRPTKSKKASGI